MRSERLRTGILFVSLGILIAACSGPSRVASTPVDVPGQVTGEPTQVPGEATDAPSQVETLMAGELATQTAIAAGGQPGGEEPPPTATPEPTQPPAAGEEPTPIPPTATEEPEQEPEDTPEPEPEADCSSPYTVVKGDWVWDIGRRCNIHPNAIIAANNLVYPYTIYAGDVLILPDNAPPFPGP
jgi:LysM repeat protein